MNIHCSEDTIVSMFISAYLLGGNNGECAKALQSAELPSCANPVSPDVLSGQNMSCLVANIKVKSIYENCILKYLIYKN